MLAWVTILTALHPAYALDVTRHREGEWVVVTADFSHKPEALRALVLQDPKTMNLGTGVRSVKAEPLANGCTKLEVENTGLMRAYSYTAERCAIENGWHSKMTASPDFKDHQIVWQTVPYGTGSRVTIRVKVEPKFRVPRFLMTRIIGGSLEKTLERIDARLIK